MRHVKRGLALSCTVALLLAGCADDADDDSTIGQESTETVTEDAASEDDVAPGEATWTRVAAEESIEHVGSLDVQGELTDVAITESGFVAVGVAEGNAAVWTSTDGVSWRRATQVPDTNPPGWSGGVALTEDGTLAVISPVAATDRGPFGKGEVAVWSSGSFVEPDRNWNRVVDGPAVFGDDTNLVDVTQGGPGWVAVGNSRDDDSGATSPVVWTADSEDSWTRVPHDEAVFDGQMIGVVSGDQGLLAFGHTGHPRPVVWTSPDGVSWTRVLLDEALFDDAFPTPSRHAVVAGGPGWVAVGGTTDDRFDWVDSTNWGGDGGPAAWTSPDGITWTRVPDDAFVGGPDEQLVAVTATPSRLVAIGEGSSLWVSTDGMTWTNIPHEVADDDTIDVAAAAAHGNQMIVVGAVGGGGVPEARPAVCNVTLPVSLETIPSPVATSSSSRVHEATAWRIELNDAGPGIHTVFMITTFPLREADIQDLGGRLVWDEAEIELCRIGIRSVGDGFVRIGDIFQTTEGCGTNTGMQQAFDDYGLPETACVHVRADGIEEEYCVPLAIG